MTGRSSLTSYRPRWRPASAPALGAPVMLSEVLRDGLRVHQREKQGAPTNFLQWALKVPEPKTGVLNFDLFPLQRELYSDEVTNAEEVVVMKSTQVGVSTWGLRTALHAADDRGDTALYIFPTQTHVSDFSAERVGPAIQGSEYLLRRIPAGSVDQMKLKRVGNGWVHFRGSESRAGAQSVAAQFVVFDEYDELSPPNLEQIERRTSGARQLGYIPRTRRVGIPRYEGLGIHGRFERSDQRVWTVTCEHCGEELIPDFFRHMRWRCEGDAAGVVRKVHRDPDHAEVLEAWRACDECETPFDVASGRWIAKFPGRRVIGFHLTRMCIPLTDLLEIVRNSRKTEPYAVEAFYSNDLGIPYETEEGRLSRQAIRQAQRPYALVEGADLSITTVRTMGVDVASRRKLNVRISEHTGPGRKKALWIAEVESFEDLDDLMRRYAVDMAVVDHLPEFKKAQEFQQRFLGRVYIVNYDTTDRPKGSSLADILKADHTTMLCQVRRTEAIDTVLEGIRQQRNELPEVLPPKYEDQLRGEVRRTEVDEKGVAKVFYERKAPSDYLHAEVYDTVARAVYEFHRAITALETPEHKSLDELINVERSAINDPAQEHDYRVGPADYHDIADRERDPWDGGDDDLRGVY